MNSVVLSIVKCSFNEVQKAIKTNGELIIVSKRDQKRLKNLRNLLNSLHNSGHLG